MLRFAWLVALVWGAACSFDTSGLPHDGGGGGPDGGGGGDDAGIPDADPQSCPANIHIEIQANGRPLTPVSGPVDVLVGDTVSLTSNGTCVKAPPMSVTWTISPPDTTTNTIRPTSAARNITLYPTDDREYLMTFTVRDSGGRSDMVTLSAIRAHGFQAVTALPGGNPSDVRDLSVGDGRLWLATKGGPFSVALDDYSAVSDLSLEFSDGSGPPTDLATVFHRQGSGTVWFGGNAKLGEVYRLDLGAERWDAVTFTEVLGANADVYDIGNAPAGVRIGTELGSATAATGDNQFSNPFVPALDAKVHAVARSSGREWGGGFALYDLANPNFAQYYFGDMADQKIRTLTIDTALDRLWIAGDRGIALANGAGAALGLWQGPGAGLASDKMRESALEASGAFAGDMWFANERGVVRFKTDRNVLFVYTEAHGIPMDRVNSKSIAIDLDGGRRVVFVGSGKGLMYLRVP